MTIVGLPQGQMRVDEIVGHGRCAGPRLREAALTRTVACVLGVAALAACRPLDRVQGTPLRRVRSHGASTPHGRSSSGRQRRGGRGWVAAPRRRRRWRVTRMGYGLRRLALSWEQERNRQHRQGEQQLRQVGSRRAPADAYKIVSSALRCEALSSGEKEGRGLGVAHPEAWLVSRPSWRRCENRKGVPMRWMCPRRSSSAPCRGRVRPDALAFDVASQGIENCRSRGLGTDGIDTLQGSALVWKAGRAFGNHFAGEGSKLPIPASIDIHENNKAHACLRAV